MSHQPKSITLPAGSTCDICGKPIEEGQPIFVSVFKQLFGYRGMDPADVAHWSCLTPMQNWDAEAMDASLDATIGSTDQS